MEASLQRKHELIFYVAKESDCSVAKGIVTYTQMKIGARNQFYPGIMYNYANSRTTNIRTENENMFDALHFKTNIVK